ncbi:hypothetical protein OOJ91_12460 [Micromonospora lupini]|uniref:hypothetical protein n=1 Tax=Micromonospora lupini TaxID=285679 RepID=UPI0022562CCD|nr:hypothetical protein [Micromonospora lupini]MCX5066692.1 hypothetical protein [Micromonospora lupini]
MDTHTDTSAVEVARRRATRATMACWIFSIAATVFSVVGFSPLERVTAFWLAGLLAAVVIALPSLLARAFALGTSGVTRVGYTALGLAGLAFTVALLWGYGEQMALWMGMNGADSPTTGGERFSNVAFVAVAPAVGILAGFVHEWNKLREAGRVGRPG